MKINIPSDIESIIQKFPQMCTSKRLAGLTTAYDYESWILADFYELITALTANQYDR